MFHSEGNKGGSFSDCWCITDICICRSDIGSKTIGVDDNGSDDKQIMVGDSELTFTIGYSERQGC